MHTITWLRYRRGQPRVRRLQEVTLPVGGALTTSPDRTEPETLPPECGRWRPASRKAVASPSDTTRPAARPRPTPGSRLACWSARWSGPSNCSNTASPPQALSNPSGRYTAPIASSSRPIRDERLSNAAGSRGAATSSCNWSWPAPRSAEPRPPSSAQPQHPYELSRDARYPATRGRTSKPP